jgi:hypothetical protein
MKFKLLQTTQVKRKLINWVQAMLLGGPGQGHKEKIYPRLTKRKTTCEIGGILRFASLWFQAHKSHNSIHPGAQYKLRNVTRGAQRNNTGK